MSLYKKKYRNIGSSKKKKMFFIRSKIKPGEIETHHAMNESFDNHELLFYTTSSHRKYHPKDLLRK